MELGFGGGKGKWKESMGADRYRRGLYTMFLRTTPYPQLVNFDAPESLLSCTQRERSTTPLQSLNLLNDPVFVEAAQVMAVRILREERGSWEDRLNYALPALAGSRSPSGGKRSPGWLLPAAEAASGETGRVGRHLIPRNRDGRD